MEISPWLSTVVAYSLPVILASTRLVPSVQNSCGKTRADISHFLSSLASIPDHGDLNDVEMDDGTAFDIPGLDRL